jgi:predicted GNAT family acetyltransferase
MDKIQFELNEKDRGAFYIVDGEERIGEMLLSVSGKDITVYHTEVVTEAEGKGLAIQMLNEMVAYARRNNLKVIALCPYVHAQFTRQPNEYTDIWKRE